jgi:DNA-binding CsgD family transcriptional regulator
MIERVTPIKPLSPMQYAVAVLLGLSYSHDEIAGQLRISRSMVRSHMREAMRKLPGDLPRETRIVAWVRGASIDVLDGMRLRGQFMLDAQRQMIDVPEEVASL